jgi:hypothetical protein
MEIKKETFVNADEQTTKELTFDLLVGIHDKVDKLTMSYEKHMPICEERFIKIEKRKKLDTATAAGSGVVGGFLAVVAQWLGFGGPK